MVSAKEILILQLLQTGRKYGLELVNQSGGKLKRGTVYITLARMEEKGLIKSLPVPHKGMLGPPRRMYRITELGLLCREAGQRVQTFLKKAK